MAGAASADPADTGSTGSLGGQDNAVVFWPAAGRRLGLLIGSGHLRAAPRFPAPKPMTITRCLLLSLALLAWIAVPAAQNKYCDSSQFNSLTNIWKPQPDQNTGQVTAVELAAERKIMVRVLDMFKSAFVPTGAIGYHSANYDILPQAVTNKSRYGNTYSFVLSHHKIECVNGKPVALDVSLGNVSVQVNTSFVGEATSPPDVGFSFLPRGYYQRKEKTELPQANDQGIQEFNFVDGTTVWWLTRGGVLPFRVVTRREFLQKQIEILKSRSGTSAKRLAYYEGLLSESPDEVAIVKEIEVVSLNGHAHVFTTLADRASRVYVTVNPDYYDRSQPKSVPQHILIRLTHGNAALLNSTGIGARHLESFQQLREIVRANLAELRATVK